MIIYSIFSLLLLYYPAVTVGSAAGFRLPFAPVNGEPAGCMSAIAVLTWLTVSVVFHKLGVMNVG